MAARDDGDRIALAAELHRRLGPAPQARDWPLVSIVVLNRDGADRLRSLLAGLRERTDYQRLELIVVDNASSDDSLDLLRAAEAPFPISIVANRHNESFADGCNQGAALAQGELLLFLNNDAEPFEPGWLRELVACLRACGAGAVGPTLLEAAEGGGGSCGYVIQQRGIGPRDKAGVLGPARRGRLADPLGDRLGEDVEAPAVVGACLLIGRDAFEAVGGFTRGYWYGPEDVDLALKLRERGMSVICSGRSHLIHPANSTLKTLDPAQRRAWARGNGRLFMERWGPRLRREYELDRLHGGGLWAEPDTAGRPLRHTRSELEALAFCFRVPGDDDPADGAAAESPALLCSALRERGHRCLVLPDGPDDDPAALDCDVAVYLRGLRRHVPKPAQLNLLWCFSHLDAVTAIEGSRYDLVISRRGSFLDRLGGEGLPAERWAELDGDDTATVAANLAAAAQARAGEVGFQTRVRLEPALQSR